MKQILRNIIGLVLLVILIFIAYGPEINDYSKQFRKEEVKLTDTDSFKIYFIDVGEADSILVEDKGEFSLIDTGNNEDGPKLVNYFKELGITKFKYVIGTHPHEDHIGGMDDIIRNFDIEHIYMPDVQVEYKTYTEIVDLVTEKNMNIETPQIDSTFVMNDSLFKVLWISKDEEDINDDSIVLKLNYKNTSYIFTGDATKNVEFNILDKDLSSDVLKVGHHGAGSSTSAQFLKAVSPQYAIISVGKLNDYNHPHNITIKKLNRLNIKTYRTDLDGTIILSSDGENISFETLKTDTNGN